MRIFVGNLNYRTDDNGLRAAFEPFGDVTEANVVVDRYTDRSRGFGFVDMPDNGQAVAAITALNGQEVDERKLTVNESQPKERRF
jgi:cold-inducible RNA-binding protein